MLGKHQILLIEDDLRLGKTLSLLFQYLPVQVTQAQKASSACERLNQDHYDLMILDLKDDELNQFSNLTQADHTPLCSEIIILSDTVNKDEMKKILRDHKLTFLPKPFDPQKLIYIVEKAVDRVYVS